MTTSLDFIRSCTATLPDTVNYRRFNWDSVPTIPVGVSTIMITWAGSAALKVFTEHGQATLENIDTQGRLWRVACRQQSTLTIQALRIREGDLRLVLGVQIIGGNLT